MATTKKIVPQVTSVERVQLSFPKLKAASTELNLASDRLNDSAAGFDVALKKFGLGISSWVRFDSDQNDHAGIFWTAEIGYTKTSGKWGLAIKTTTQDGSEPEPEVELWPFKDAPRLLRLKAAPYIPDLLDQLIEDAAKAAKEVSEHTQGIEALTAVILAQQEGR